MQIESFEPDAAQAARAARVATVVSVVVGAVGALLVGVGAGAVARGGPPGSVVASAAAVLGCGYVLLVVLRAARPARTRRRVEVRAGELRLVLGDHPALDLPWSVIAAAEVVEPLAGARRYPPPSPQLRLLLHTAPGAAPSAGISAVVPPHPALHGRSGRIRTFPLDFFPLTALRAALSAAQSAARPAAAAPSAQTVVRASWALALRQAAPMLVLAAGLAWLVAMMAPLVVDSLSLGLSAAALLPLAASLGVVFSLVVAARRIVVAARGELRVGAGTVELERPGAPPLVIRTAENRRMWVERPRPTRRGMRWPLGGTPTCLAVLPRPGSPTAAALTRLAVREGACLVDLAGFDPVLVEEALGGVVRRGGQGGQGPEAPRVAGRTVEG